MKEYITILDCYTDEPAGLGVPPFIGTYPRYIAGYIKETSNTDNIIYITIDDLRLFYKYNSKIPITKESEKTDISVYNLTKNYKNIKDIIKNTKELIIIAGIHTPGKYLSAKPAKLKEIKSLTTDFKSEKTITGPAIFGTSVEGGKFFEKTEMSDFNLKEMKFSYEKIKNYAPIGSKIIKQIEGLRIAEIETARGCQRKEGCSFCTEPLKNKKEFRKKEDIIEEIKALHKQGIIDFRLGKQSDFYAYPDAIELLKDIREKFNPRTLHIDNVNPASVISKKGIEITKAIVEYCTEGNIAAFGVESFDKEVIKKNNLNSDSDTTIKAIEIINKYGKEKGPNGMHKFLPGINLILGLIGESKQTHQENIKYLKEILKKDLLIRRVNIRQVNIFKDTPLEKKAGNKFIKKNKKYYWKWKDEIRREFDIPMLKKLFPINTILKNIRTEIYDGKTTFARHIGTYPIIVGIKGRYPLKEFYNIKVTNHMLRSITGEIIKK